MSNLTKKSEIYKGNIVKIYLNHDVEGWAELLEQVGEPISYIEGKNMVSLKEKWKVRFVEEHEVPVKLTTRALWQQRSMAGFVSHRWVRYFGEQTWERFVTKFGLPKEQTYEDRREHIDDSNLIF